jgi:hypothetical protein
VACHKYVGETPLNCSEMARTIWTHDRIYFVFVSVSPIAREQQHLVFANHKRRLELLRCGFQPRFQKGQLRLNRLPLPCIWRQPFLKVQNSVVRLAGVVMIPADGLFDL